MEEDASTDPKTGRTTLIDSKDFAMIRALICIAVMTCVPLCGEAADTPVRLMTLDPGHLHAALVQKFMYPQVNPVVHVCSPGGPDLEGHLKRIDGFNTRSENPTA